MSTISAALFASVSPNVLAAGGAAIDLNGLFLTENTRVPVGQVQSFPNAAAVSAYFGASAAEVTQANVYFGGFTGADVQPGALLFAQYPAANVAAYLRGGNAGAALTLAQLQAINGSLTVVFDGYSRTGSAINLSGASSFSAAAGLIATGLNGALPTEASFTGVIAPETTTLTGSIAGNVLTVTNVASGTVVAGGALTGTGVAANTSITSQLSGSAGSIGTYAVNVSQVVASETLTETYGQLTASASSGLPIAVGQTVLGAGVTAASIITQAGTGTGGNGTYFLNLTQTVGSEAMTTQPSPVTVAYDSVSGGFIITSGYAGAGSTAAFPNGGISANLLLTAATGAVLSQGAAAASPGAFMDSIKAITQNWASFKTMFDPDGGSAGGSANKLAFSLWTSQQKNRYLYVPFDMDPSPTLTVPASSSFGQLLKAAAYSGTAPVWELAGLTGQNLSAFVCGYAASIDFEEDGGRAAAAFKGQGGLVAGVTTDAVAVNLGGNPQSAGDFGNGYNYYGAVGVATTQFVFFQRGTVSGPFTWIDSYVNQIWLNANLQLDLITLFATAKSIPFNGAGQGQIEAAMLDTINQGVTNGVITTGVTLSASQVASVNTAVGLNVAPVLQTRGWYLNIPIPPPSIRSSRGPWPIQLFYTDGGSVQSISLGSEALQ